jgi:ligand-binding sensor domain-containing protein
LINLKKILPLQIIFAQLILLLCSGANAQQQPYFINITEKNGLSDNNIQCFVKDKTGYLWVGTANGLNRFDGTNFKIYKPSAGKKNYLSNGFVTAVKQDDEGNIWAATQKGLNRIDARTDTTEVVNIENQEFKIKLPTESVWDVLPDGNAVWIAIDTKPLVCYNIKTKQSRYFNFKQFLTNNKIEFTPVYHSIFKIVPDGSHGLWLATTEGIVHFNKPTGIFTLIVGQALDEITFLEYNSVVKKLYYAAENKIVYCYDVTAKKITSILFHKKNKAAKSIQPWFKQDAILFMPGKEGLTLINEQDDMVSFLKGDAADENALLDAKINTVYKDREGIVWIGTTKGVSRFIPQLNNNLNVKLPKKILFDEEFSLKNILYQPLQNQWLVASYADNKIWKIDNATAAVSQLIKPAIYKNEVCYAFYSRHADTVFMLCDGVLLVYYPKQNKWNKIVFPPPWNNSTITCMEIDAAGSYWLGTRRKGLFVYDLVTKKIWTPYDDIKEANIVHAIKYDSINNCMWIGSYSTGLHSYNFTDSSLKHIQRNDADTNAIHASLINDLAVDGKNLWVATVQGGLAKYSITEKEKKITNYDFKNGLPDNNVYSVAVADGAVFLGTGKGIGMIEKDGTLKTFFNTQSGLPFSNFQQSIVALPNGKVATAVGNHFFCFDTKAISLQKTSPVIINQIILNDGLPVNFSQSQFSHHKNTFQFYFTALDFISPQATAYFYMLEGFDKTWINNGKQHTSRYANLPPGNYTFKVKINSVNGVVGAQQAIWSFTVLPPFWKTWWFIMLAVLVTAAIIYFVLKHRFKTIRRQEQIKSNYEKKIAETEMQALRAQMNPHFMFNSLNSINNFILKNDPDNASGYLTKFSRLMRLILDNSRSEWVLLENELKALELYIELEAVRFDNAFTYSIEVTQNISVETVMVPPLLIQPYVENAIWHGLLHRNEPGGKLDIRLWKNNETLYIEIEDNGVGRDEAKRLKSKTATKQKSHGMKITAERMDIVNKVYNVDAGVTITDLKNAGDQKGTRVLITLKYQTHDSHYSGR